MFSCISTRICLKKKASNSSFGSAESRICGKDQTDIFKLVCKVIFYNEYQLLYTMKNVIYGRFHV